MPSVKNPGLKILRILLVHTYTE
jgi:hypothetical protein